MKIRKPPADQGEVVSTRTVDGVVVRTVKMREQWRPMKLEIRKVEPVARAQGDGNPEEDDFAIYEFAFASEEPVERWIPGVGWALEVLSHDPKDVDLSRMKDGGSWRDGHYGDQVGVSEDAWVKGKQSWTRGRFSKNPRPQEIERDVVTGIRKNVSAGYLPRDYWLLKKGEGDALPTYACSWTAYHNAFVADGADATVGFRSEDGGELHTVTIRGGLPREEQKAMKKKIVLERGALIEVPEDDAREAATLEQVRTATAVIEREAPEQTPATVKPRANEPGKKTRTEEVDEIRAAAKDFAIPDDIVNDCIMRDLTPDQAIVVMRQTMAKTRATAQPVATRAGMSWKDAKRFKIRNALAIAANLKRADGIEGEVHRFLLANKPQEQPYNGGTMIPYDIRDLVLEGEQIDARHEEIMERLAAQVSGRTMDTVTAGKGPELIGSGIQLIDLLRPELILAKAGATILTGLSTPIPFAKKTAAVQFKWYGEGRPLDLSDQKYVPLELGLKRCGGAIDVSNELLLSSSMSVDRMIEADMTEGGSLTIDQGGLTGIGGVEPLGLLKLPASAGVQTVSMGNTVPTWVKLTQIPGMTARKNALKGNLAWITTPELATAMQGTPRVPGAAAGWLWEGGLDNGTVAGYRAYATSQLVAVASDHPLVFGPWQHQIMGFWGGAEVKLDPYGNQMLNNTTRFVLNLVANTINRYPEAFVIAAGARTA